MKNIYFIKPILQISKLKLSVFVNLLHRRVIQTTRVKDCNIWQNLGWFFLQNYLLKCSSQIHHENLHLSPPTIMNLKINFIQIWHICTILVSLEMWTAFKKSQHWLTILVRKWGQVKNDLKWNQSKNEKQLYQIHSKNLFQFCKLLDILWAFSFFLIHAKNIYVIS